MSKDFQPYLEQLERQEEEEKLVEHFFDKLRKKILFW